MSTKISPIELIKILLFVIAVIVWVGLKIHRMNHPRNLFDTITRHEAIQGDANAQFRLGVKHDISQGVDQDDEQAVYWYRKAADQGHAEAQFNLGVMYDNGRGVEHDEGQAVAWYRKAAKQDFEPSQSALKKRGLDW